MTTTNKTSATTTPLVGKVTASSFQSMGLEKELLQGLRRMNYNNPTPVQRKALPIVLAGLDIVCMARTGSGKTCVFLLPMIQKLKTHQPIGSRGLVLSPTRELALQTYKFTRDMAKFTDLRIISILGGDSMDSQFDALSSKPDIIIATPGRLMHHLHEIKTFHLKSIQYLVFDEADRLFEMGFQEQLNEIIKKCNPDRQTLLFSATLPKLLVQFSRAGLKDPQLIRLDTDIKMSEELRIGFFMSRSNEKLAALLYLVRYIIPENQQTIIFTATRHHSELIHAIFQLMHFRSTVIYGSMDQDARNNNLKSFRQQEVNYLIVTDIAARGIDIPLLNNVINFHFPSSAKLFVHRCGRAARQGRIGYAFSLVEPEELPYLCDVHTLLGLEVHNGLVPVLSLPRDSSGNTNPQDASSAAYDLINMTPQMVHTGLLPQHKLNEENDYLKQIITDHDNIATLFRISENGYQQYKRTRPTASHLNVKKYKTIVKYKLINTIHPLIHGVHPDHCDDMVIKQQQFIQSLQTYRPHLTVFETNIGTGCVHNNHKQQQLNKNMMKELRKTTMNALERNKKGGKQSLLLSRGDGEEEDEEEEQEEEDHVGVIDHLDDHDGDELLIQDEFDNEGHHEQGDDAEEAEEADDDMEGQEDNQSVTPTINPTNQKKRLSAAEKRKLKKYGILPTHTEEDIDEKMATITPGGGNNTGGNSRFQDPKYFMAYGTENEKSNYAEEAMQPLANLKTSELFAASAYGGQSGDLTYEDDPAQESLKKKRIMRWDPKKRKFVKQTLGEIASSQKKGLKRMRSEAGALTSIKPSDKKQGEMYERWRKKRRMEINSPEPGAMMMDDGGDDEDVRQRPNIRANKGLRSELRSADEVRKIVKKRDDVKVKNMPKEKRRKIEKKQRMQKKATQQASAPQFGGRGGGRGGGGRGRR